jgi:EamA domain-containing membrane protein RarD
MGAILALISAIAWGVADYIGGIASRKAGATPVLVAAYPAGAVILSVFVFLVPGEFSMLARMLLRERLSRVQLVGVVLALAAAALLALA